MRRPLLRLVAALSLATLGTAACGDSPTTGGEQTTREQAQIGFSLNLAGIPVNTLVVQVTASDISTPLAFNIPVSNGTATGSISVPPGLARTITVRAFDAQGTLTHQGSATVDVRPGANVNVTIAMTPQAGHVPITINMGSMVVSIARVGTPPSGGNVVGDTVRLRGTVTYANGTPVAGAQVRWATLNPAIATVDSLGLVTGRAQGATEIVATYNGYGAVQSVSFVVADGTNGTTDRTPPRLLDFTVSPDTANMASSNAIEVTFAATASDAMAYYAMSVLLTSPDGQTSRDCYYSNNPQPGTSTRSCSVVLSRYGQAGRWTIGDLTISDSRGNSRTFTGAELAAAGYDSGVTVTNTSTDTGAPVLQGASFTPDSITPGSGYSQATIRIVATDALSGVERVEVSGSNDEGTFGFGGGGSVQVGPDVWESYLMIDSQYPPAGVIRINFVRITDRAGNITFVGPEQLEAMGMRATLTIVR